MKAKTEMLEIFPIVLYRANIFDIEKGFKFLEQLNYNNYKKILKNDEIIGTEKAYEDFKTLDTRLKNHYFPQFIGTSKQLNELKIPNNFKCFRKAEICDRLDNIGKEITNQRKEKWNPYDILFTDDISIPDVSEFENWFKESFDNKIIFPISLKSKNALRGCSSILSCGEFNEIKETYDADDISQNLKELSDKLNLKVGGSKICTNFKLTNFSDVLKNQKFQNYLKSTNKIKGWNITFPRLIKKLNEVDDVETFLKERISCALHNTGLPYHLVNPDSTKNENQIYLIENIELILNLTTQYAILKFDKISENTKEQIVADIRDKSKHKLGNLSLNITQRKNVRELEYLEI